MANPRKFSEKIALQKQKQAEGTAEFERIMKEVYATKMDETHAHQKILECCLAAESGGSAVRGSAGSGGTSPDGSAQIMAGVGCSSPSGYRESRGRSIGGGPMRRPSERKQDRSPYGSNATAVGGTSASCTTNNAQNIAYLSPPPMDNAWRRSNSDSALHQSLNIAVATGGSYGPIGISGASADLIALQSNYEHGQRSHSPNIGRSYSPHAPRKKGNILGLQQQQHQQPFHVQQQQHHQQQIQQQQQHQLQQHHQHQQEQQQHQHHLSPAGQQNFGTKFYNCSIPASSLFKSLQDQAMAIANTGSLPDLTSTRYTTPSQSQQPQITQILSPVSSPHGQSNSNHGEHEQPSSSYSVRNTVGASASSFHQQQNSSPSTMTPISGPQTSPHLSFTSLNVQRGRTTQPTVQISSGDYVHLPTLGAANSTGNLTDYRQPLNPPSPGSSPGLLNSASGNDMHSSAPTSPVRYPQKQVSIQLQQQQQHQLQQQQQQGYDMKSLVNACEGYTDSSYNSLNHAFHNNFEQFSLGDGSSSPEQRQHFQQQQHNLFSSLDFENFGGNNDQQQNYSQSFIQNKLLESNINILTSRGTATTINSNSSESTSNTLVTTSRTSSNNQQQQRQHLKARTQTANQQQQHQQQKQLLGSSGNCTGASSLTISCNPNNNSANNFVVQQQQHHDISSPSSPHAVLSAPSSPLTIPISISTHNQQQSHSLTLSQAHPTQYSPHSASPVSVSSPGLSPLSVGDNLSPTPDASAINVCENSSMASNNHHIQHQSNAAAVAGSTTTTNIPSIIFSDYSSNSDFPREIFDTLDLDLGQMDVAGLQMLSDPNSIMIPDPSLEDEFRGDLN